MAAEGKERVLRLIDFLAAFDAQKNPPVHDIASYGLFVLREADVPVMTAVHLDPSAESWLTVDFVDLPPALVLPAELEGCFPPGTAITAARPPEPLAAGEPTEGAAHSPGALERANRWIGQVWQPWSATSEAAQRAKKLYRDLFEQRERLATDRDTFELVWGFGRLRYRPEAAVVVDHPVLSIPAEIDIDLLSGQLRVAPAGALTAEALFLADIAMDDSGGFNAVRHTLADTDTPIDPWDRESTMGLVRRVVRAVDHDGIMAGPNDESLDPREGPAVGDGSWVLYLRRRRPDYQGFLDQMRQLYEAGAVPPDPLRALVVDAPSMLVGDELDDDATGLRASEPLLLPLATNEEQQRILHLAQRRPGVTVQGPPGTGKSHTIANLISHYVAYGQRVLVVAAKEQALEVLAEKIPAGIRDLTVSVLGADEAGRRRLESAIGQIQSRVTAMDKTHTDHAIVRLTAELDGIDRTIAETTGRLLAARAAEIDHLDGHFEAGTNPTPTDAARWVAETAAELGYIDDRLRLDQQPPIAPPELADLVALAEQIGPQQAEACTLSLPDLSMLPAGRVVAQRVATRLALDHELDAAAPEISRWDLIDRAHPDAVEAAATDVAADHTWLSSLAGTWLEGVLGQLGDPLLAASWDEFVATARSEREQAVTLASALAADQVTVPDDPLPTFSQQLREAAHRLEQHQRLGRFAKEAKEAVGSCTVNGHTPTTADEVQLCLHSVRLAELRRQLANRYTSHVTEAGGPELDGGGPVERTIGPVLDALEAAMAWPKRWTTRRAVLRELGITAPVNPGVNDLARMQEVAHRATRRPDRQRVVAELDQLHETLLAGAALPQASPLWLLLADALASQRTETWDQYRAEVADLVAAAPGAARLADLRHRLAAAAPLWTGRILADGAAAGQAADLLRAWQWRQLDTWLQDFLRGDNPAALQHRLEELSDLRRRTIAELVSERAWRRLADNVGDRQRQALNSYVQAVKRYGKTGGKFAARWLSQIRSALDESKDAIPVWIMPSSRALTSFRPESVPPFDVLIIDEASQLGLETLPLLSLAKTSIVVGDDKQTSPDNVGLDRQSVFDLLRDYLAVVPHHQTLFDPDNSLYDVAFQKFPDVVMLTEHFRCLPPIIAFSNLHAYDGRIIPLRDRLPEPDWRPLRAISVADGYRVGDANEPEADAVVDLIERLDGDRRYDGMDFGVISLLGSSQSKMIWDKLFARLGPDIFTNRRLRCGEPANFQGSERHVIIVSTVVADEPGRPAGRIGAMTGRAAERRINVAASRAQDQMWVVHSVSADRFPNGDLRAELIRHCTERPFADPGLDDLESRCESDFERQMLRRILARGYRNVKVQHTVGRYRIDMVIEGPTARLAVECDGDRWHGEEVWHQDRARQQVLERAGWTFERIRGSAFYRDPDRALQPLWSRLDDLGISTGSPVALTTAQ